eukprot:922057_1
MLRTILALKYQSLRARRLYLYSPWHRCTFSSQTAVKTVRVVPEKRTADEIIDIQTTTRAVINGDTQTARSPIPSPKSFLNAAKVGHTQTVSSNSEPLVSETVSTNSEPRVSQAVSAKSDISVSQGRSDVGLEIGKSQCTIANNVEAEEPSQLNNCSDQAVSQSTSPAESHQSTIQDKIPTISDISSSEDPNTEIRVLNDTTPLDSSPTVTVEPQVSQNTGCCEPSVLSLKEVPLVSQNNKSQSVSPQSEYSSQIYASQNQSHSTDISPECNSTLASQSTSKIIYKSELSKSNASQSQPSQSNVSQSQKSKSISSQSELSSQTEAPGIQSSQSEAPGIQQSQSEEPGIQPSQSEAPGIQQSQSEAPGIQPSQSEEPGVQSSQSEAPGIQTNLKANYLEYSNPQAKHQEYSHLKAKHPEYSNLKAIPEQINYRSLNRPRHLRPPFPS